MGTKFKSLKDLLEVLPMVVLGNEEDPPANEDPAPDDNNDSSKGSETLTKAEHEEMTKGLKTALEAERKLRADAEKAAKAAAKEKADRELAEKSEIDQAKILAEQASTRASKLEAQLRKSAIETAILAAAKDFIDPTDAFAGVDMKAVTLTETDEGFDVDLDFVNKAVEEFARKKPHLLKTTDEDEDDAPTGSTGWKAKKKNNKSDESLKALYPALR